MIKANKRIVLLVIVITSIFCYVLTSPTYSNIDDSINEKRLLFLGNKNIAPIVYEEKGIPKGIAIDLVKAIENKIGYRIEIQTIDWAEAQNKVLRGEADAIIQFNPNPERGKLFDFSDELLESEFSIFIHGGNSEIKSADDLIGRSVGVEEGGYSYHLLSAYSGVDIVSIKNVRTGFQKILTGEIDAIVADRWIGEYELAKNNFKQIHLLEEPLERQFSRIAVKKGNEELLDLINTGLSEIRQDNSMNLIIKNWKGKNVIYFTEERIVSIVIFIAIGLILFILIISSYLINRYKKLSKKLEIDVRERTKELYEANELLRQANLELEKLSVIDELTDIYNRRYFDNGIEKAWRIAMRENKPLALIMIDVDKFKKFNDTYGHLAGDYCLRCIASTIKQESKRSGDFVARFGGEEFVVVMTNTTVEGARNVAEGIRKKVSKLKIDYDGIESRVTISLGVASIIPDYKTDPNDLISAADQALYKAKEAGRNIVVC